MAYRLAITGGSGQVGRAVASAAPPAWEVSTSDSSTVDVRDWNTVRDWIAAIRPNLVVHAAAMTDVDGCESEESKAYRINAAGTRNVAHASARIGATLVYLSTNFVFDGEKNDDYHEFDIPNPISVYGASKLAGEIEALQSHPNCYVVRTAMVYDDTGKNFVNTMMRLMAERDTISVVDDQYGNPTYAPDLARGLLRLIQTHPPGMYHLTNRDSTSWFGWASEIQRIGDFYCEVQPTTAAEFPRAATPPQNGAMTSLNGENVFEDMPDWRDALRRCLS